MVAVASVVEAIVVVVVVIVVVVMSFVVEVREAVAGGTLSSP